MIRIGIRIKLIIFIYATFINVEGWEEENVRQDESCGREKTSQIRVISIEGDGNELEASSAHVKGVKAPISYIKEVPKALEQVEIDVRLIKGDNNNVKVKGNLEASGLEIN